MFVKGDLTVPYVPLHVLGLYQEGGEIVPMEEPTPGEGEGNPMEEIITMAIKALQEQDPNMAMQVCQMLVEFVKGEQQETSEENVNEEQYQE